MRQAAKGRLDKCIKCGTCVVSCPVASTTPNFTGPKHMGTELTRFRLDERIGLQEDVDYCCNCRSCEIACPSGVKVSQLNAYYKSLWKGEQEKVSLRDNLLGRPGLLAQLGSFHVGVTNFMLGKDLMKRVLDKSLAISQKRSFPSYQNESFADWFKKRKSLKSDKKVIYFVGCFINYNAPQVGKSVVAVLEHNGYEVIVPHQGCCGLPLMANGYLEKGKLQGNDNLTSFLPWVEKGYKVIISCTSCSLTWKSEYEELFGLETAAEVSAAVYDFSEFLLELHQKDQLKTDFKPLNLKLGYHNPCHLKAQGMGTPSLDVLDFIPGLNTVEIDQGCCGLSGSYGFKSEKYQISMEIGKKLFTKLKEIDPDYATSDCGGCGMQITHGTGIEAIHPAELLARAYKL